MAPVDPWRTEREWAAQIAGQFGCAVEPSPHAYEIAKVTGDGVSLVVYEFTSGRGNSRARVRDNGSRDQERACRVMLALKRGEGLSPQDRDLHEMHRVFEVYTRTRRKIETALGMAEGEA